MIYREPHAMSILLSQVLLREITNIARKQRLFEACGVLLADRSNGCIAIRKIHVCPNLANNKAMGFRLSKLEIKNAKLDWCSERHRLVGVFHTHGVGLATPSMHDELVMRARPGFYLIADSTGGVYAFINRLNHVLAAAVVITQHL